MSILKSKCISRMNISFYNCCRDDHGHFGKKEIAVYTSPFLTNALIICICVWVMGHWLSFSSCNIACPVYSITYHRFIQIIEGTKLYSPFRSDYEFWNKFWLARPRMKQVFALLVRILDIRVDQRLNRACT